MIHRPDYSQLPKNCKVVFLASGGRDSTAMVLEAKKLGIRGLLLHGDTGIEKKEALETLDKLHELTGYELVHVRPKGNVAEILKESFSKIPAVIEASKRVGAKRRNLFRCCIKLKHKPMNDYINENCKDAILVIGLKGSDGAIHRRYRMRELRDGNTFLRLHKNGLLYYYPLRDCRDSDIDEILKEFGFEKTKHSGCRVCPIFACSISWVKRDPETWIRSRAYARRLGIEFPNCEQTDLTQFFPCEAVRIQQ